MLVSAETYGEFVALTTSTTNAADNIQALCDDSVRVSDTCVAVRSGLETRARLAAAGVQLHTGDKGPPQTGMISLYDHQLDSRYFLVGNPRAFDLSDPGTGKTISAASAADVLIRAGITKRVLIVCPLSIMRAAWTNDLFRACMHRTVGVAYGTPEKRRKVVESGYEFVIVNFDGVEAIKDQITNNQDFNLFIIDEGNAYADATTKRWKLMNKIVRAVPNRWLWLMTGTPAANSPEQAYGLGKLVVPHKAPTFFSEWRERVMYKVSEYRWIPRRSAPTSVSELLQPAIRHSKGLLNLPPLVYQEREVTITPQQKKYYDMLRKEFIIETRTATVLAVNAAIKHDKLVQIACGMVYDKDGNALMFDVTPKLRELDDVAASTQNKIIVFTPYKHTLWAIEKHAKSKGVSYALVNGDVSKTQRDRIFESFQNDREPKWLIAHPECMQHGLTLTAADTIVWWGPTSNFDMFEQANARIHRNTQRHACRVVTLMCSPAERQMHRMCLERKQLSEDTLGLYKQMLEDTDFL